MRFLFVVQGEGRGHMTQAIALRQILIRNGHELCGVLVGKSRSRRIPAFFRERMQGLILTFESPNFSLDAQRRGVSVWGTFFESIRRFPLFLKGLTTVHKAVRELKPDLIINFFDPLAAIYKWLFRPKPRLLCIAHQYLMLHPDFPFPRGGGAARRAMLWFVRLCALGAEQRLALSFRRLPDVAGKRLKILPPLLRSEVRTMEPVRGDFILAYVLNDGYASDLAAAQRRFPEQKIVGFWDRRGAAEAVQLQENLIFHPLSDTAFLDAMRRCRGLISTAGFESICEAMYLGKPVYMMPARRQMEQLCNALDASLSGAGIWGFGLDLGRFMRYLTTCGEEPQSFRRWVESADGAFLEVINGLQLPPPGGGLQTQG